MNLTRQIICVIFSFQTVTMSGSN